ncbi:thiamine pyrophosphate-dependent enzyme [Oceanidesulfovibrio marinus]|uniref:2-oxoacid ferredoxin oxidoreductase n=1 Tax=Oceanidesulfovibrio marinus TaxID=370038 RepID=A0A6P1ZBS4_9BACT|nr:thiamine pyrophosphate-dependent enzyme [Oceanidesulfovibrio marinus]TVM30223.1 2-oxoacid ferredoxin oxidoreductase [Oceanidesulfovibrio marinus]
MGRIEDYGEFETAWCPGCGNFRILDAVKKALADMDLPPHKVAYFSGIGQAAKLPHYFKCNMFNGLHGRGLPPAQGAKLVNPELAVFCHSGDGCNYGEGGNHFLAALRRNVDMVLVAHDNQIYGLTKGQASPTTGEGHVTKAQPWGVKSSMFKPLAVAVALRANFVARGFAGNVDQLADLIRQAHETPGFALVDVLQPCVTFNKVNTFAWYKERVYELDDSYDPTDFDAAMKKAEEFGDRIPTGVIYRNDRPNFCEALVTCGGELFNKPADRGLVRSVMMQYA